MIDNENIKTKKQFKKVAAIKGYSIYYCIQNTKNVSNLFGWMVEIHEK